MTVTLPEPSYSSISRAGVLPWGRIVTLRTMPRTVTVCPGVQQSIAVRAVSSAPRSWSCSSSASTCAWLRFQRCQKPRSAVAGWVVVMVTG